MRKVRLLSLLALLAAGCGGGGEQRQGDAAADAPMDMTGAGGTTGTGGDGGGGAGGAGATGGGGGTVTTGAEIGAVCAIADDCKSGFCFDNVCCRSDCSGLCQSCAQPGSAGNCMNVPVGADPRNDCPDDGVTGCMRNGSCDGTGLCAVYGTGTICKAQACAASTVTQASRCDGDGECTAGNSDSCGQYLCGGDGKCRSTCATAADCVAGAACVNGSCGPKPPGATCTAGNECASMICAQGVCCKTACAGACKSCAITGSEGECINVPAGVDPLGQCSDDGMMTCGDDGTCDGSGACGKYSGATTCAAATCTGSTATAPRTCNGAGTCLMVLPVSCAPYLCGSSGACRTSCTGDADCLAPNVCMGTTCGPPGTGGTGGTGGTTGAGGTTGTAGAAGTTGVAGAGGTTGSGGAAGTTGGAGGGTTGTGGAAGTTGTAGAAGTTGVAGAGGTTGSGGAAGTTGTGGAAGTTGGAGRGGTTGAAGAAGTTGTGGRGGTGCPGTVFCDDFEDGDTVGWTPNGGTWSVITDGTRVYQGGNGNTFSLGGLSTAWTDQTITARVKVTQWGGTSTSYRAGIVARATDSSNLYVFAIDASGALRLLKGTSSPSGTGASGTCGKVTPTPAAVAGTWYTMQLKIVGTGNDVFISTFFNGTMIHDCQTSVGTLPSGGAGTYIYGPNTIVEFDDVKISTP